MSVAATSIEAYEKIKPTIGKRQREVLELLMRVGALNNTEISQWLNLPVNRITPRVKELREKGLVEEAYKAEGSYGMRVSYWKAKTKPEQIDMFAPAGQECGD